MSCMLAIRPLAAFLLIITFASGVAESAAQTDQPPQGGDATRAEILNSKRWRSAVHGFKEWLSVQQVYSKEQAQALTVQFDANVAKMSASQLQDMLDDMEAKLNVLFSPEAEEARAWLANYLTAYNQHGIEKIRQKLPDVAKLTAAQMRQELLRLDQEQKQNRRTTQETRRLRDQQAQNFRAARQADQAASERARDRAVYSGRTAQPSYRSHYAPRRSYAPTSQRYYVNPWGGVGRIGW